ncbi:MAG: rod shape-determining protein MreC [Litorimonas sp.]
MARSRSYSSEGRIGLLLLILFSVGLLLSQRDAAIDRRTTPLLADDVQAPVAQWLGAPFRQVEQVASDVEDGRRALKENRALRAELQVLRSENDRLKAARERQRRLEALLAVPRTGDIPDQRIAVRAVSDASSPFVRSLLIGSGRDDGIKDGYPVLSDSGLIGHIVSTGRRSARILRLDDLNSRVAVASERTGARAILKGSNEAQPQLAFVADPEGWAPGDRIVTSGDDGRLPAGISVGTLLSGEAMPVQLDFLDDPVDWVFVLPYEGVADPDDADLPPDPEAGGAVADGTETEQAAVTPAGETG